MQQRWERIGWSEDIEGARHVTHEPSHIHVVRPSRRPRVEQSPERERCPAGIDCQELSQA
jgi:hypothetical protein